MNNKVNDKINLVNLKSIPVLENNQVYIYILENSDGYIKIGRTTNPYQRFSSLSGSNGGGSNLVRYIISKPTYLYTLERVCHIHFNKYRIKNTEWFKDDTGKFSFDIAVDYLKSILSSTEYKKCNRERELFNTEQSKINVKNINLND